MYFLVGQNTVNEAVWYPRILNNSHVGKARSDEPLGNVPALFPSYEEAETAQKYAQTKTITIRGEKQMMYKTVIIAQVAKEQSTQSIPTSR